MRFYLIQLAQVLARQTGTGLVLPDQGTAPQLFCYSKSQSLNMDRKNFSDGMEHSDLLKTIVLAAMEGLRGQLLGQLLAQGRYEKCVNDHFDDWSKSSEGQIHHHNHVKF